MRKTSRRVAGVRLIMAMVVVLVAASCAQTITTGTNPDLGSTFDLSTVGYERSESYLAGFANTYALTAPIPTNGKLQVAAEPRSAAGRYRTRLSVIRPIDPAKFNGTVIVEWLNV